jgi:glycosyltransferase involved in cell wall biosynthesis
VLITFIIATKDRPDDLRQALRSLAAQSVSLFHTVIVDGGDVPAESVLLEFVGQLHVTYIKHRPPSASAQRNAGIEAIPAGTALVGFIDDDAVLEPFALERMMSFWASAPADIAGCGFNLINHPTMRGGLLKRARIAEMPGLYSGRAGAVMPSGWHTMIGTVHETIFVDWLPSTAVVWRASVLGALRFDEFFTGYSYLEDLDFSFAASRKWRLAVLADAKYRHNASLMRHCSSFRFGRTEIRNRLYFVRKHGLSIPRCWLGIAVRLGMTMSDAIVHFDGESLRRAAGNLAEMKRVLLL